MNYPHKPHMDPRFFSLETLVRQYQTTWGLGDMLVYLVELENEENQ